MNAANRCLFLLAAAVGGIGVGQFVLSDWMMPRPPQFLQWKNGRGGAAKTGPDDGGEPWTESDAEAAKLGGGKVTNGVASADVPCAHRWISGVEVGPYRQQAVKVTGVNEDGTPRVVRIGMDDARRGFASTFRNSVRFRAKAPVDERWAKLEKHTKLADRTTGDSDEDLPPGVYPGDVYLSGIPMVNQGQTAYCAVASAARVLQNYGIDMTMEDMAELAGSSATGGTNIGNWERALRRVANSHGLELRVVHDVTDTDQPIQQLIYDYNHTARDMGYEELNAWDYANAFVIDYRKLSEDREYPVQREVMLSNERACDAFEKNITERIDESDPLFWTVRLGDVSEKGVVPGEHTNHMRLIIGYNEERGEVLYSDSWGDEHELKRMDGRDALSITRGMYYLTD